ncbi:xylose isomerase [Clostridium oryzae]|uniref:Xylose isomerase n=1 Tax=Clostridium oryzae TaxID=1450648 RepID=A0A1V4IDZ7_9CLOT|nr:xylose isomerase [Clostridium oryzae]OPJ57767.1 xylose isomerase [Clostridium oryzae]
MKEYFCNVQKIKFEGRESKNPLAFKYYDAEEMVGGKKLKDQLRFTMSYWHTLTASGADPFGVGTYVREWDAEQDPMKLAKMRMEAAFEFMNKIDIDYFAFHDRDIAPEGKSLEETNRNLDEIVDLCEGLMKKHNKKLLWGTANMFTNPRFVHGAATTCNADVFAYAAAQVKKAIEVTNRLDGENYVFWGGREGYETLLNTNMGLEQDNLARFFHMAVDYAQKIGFKGQFLIEPKPKEPTKHQYDFDTATVLGFLRKYDLDKYFKVNIEANHATLAGHTYEHEIAVAGINGALGSLDINQGDPNLGWDTDQFPTNLYDAVLAMYQVLKCGGIASGGLNFDSKVRRASFEADDLFIAYIAGMDTFAQGVKIAQKLLDGGEIENFVKERYSSFTTGIGKDIVEGKADFESLEKYIINKDVSANKSGRQEMLEAIVNKYILND